MQKNGWSYYNHAAVPTTAPHEEANTEPISDGSIWKNAGGVHLYLQDGLRNLIADMKQIGGM